MTPSTVYSKCKGDKDGREIDGVLVTTGGTDNVELTVHGDHFFYDDLQSPDAALRFDAITSADANDDGEVTLAELTAKKLVDLDPSMGAILPRHTCGGSHHAGMQLYRPSQIIPVRICR